MIINNDPHANEFAEGVADQESLASILKERGTDIDQTQMTTEDWRTTSELKALTFLVNSLYQIQSLRIGLGNRIYAHCATNLGIAPGNKVESDRKASKILKQLESEYQDITTALANSILSEELRLKLKRKSIDIDTLVHSSPEIFIVKQAEKIKAAINESHGKVDTDSDTALLLKTFNKGLINNDAEFQMARMWTALRAIENGITNELANIIKYFDMWNSFLIGVKGIGPTLAACLISTINMKKCYTVESLWNYCGLDVVEIDGVGYGRSNKKEHMIMREYVAKDGSLKQKLSLTYNPWIKSKLMGVIAGMFMKQNPEYRAIYDDVKARLQASDRIEQMRPRVKNGVPVIDKKTGEVEMVPAFPPARINMMSQRYMVKMFLLDYWVHARILMGEPMKIPYAQAKLGYQAKFRTFVGGEFVRIAFDPRLDLDLLHEIQKGPVSKYAI